MKNRILKSAAAALALLMGFSSPAAALTTYAAGGTTYAGSAYEQSIAAGVYGMHSEYEGVEVTDAVLEDLTPTDRLYAVSGAFDPVFYASEYPDVSDVLGTDEAVLKYHYVTQGVYEGRKANAEDTVAASAKITRRISLYLQQNRDYYLAHAGEADFPYFNAAEYLAKYPELKTELAAYLASKGIVSAAQDSTVGLSEEDYNKEVAKAAAENYLTYGALKGFSSCTTFDPVWAILAEPSSYDFVNGSTPDEVLAAYAKTAGNASTMSLPVGTDAVINEKNQQAGILILKKGTTEHSASAVAAQESGEESSNSEQTYVEGDDPFINAYAKYQRSPAVLYSMTGGSLLNKGTFDQDKYNEIIETIGTEDKKYTMMVFICGSNLEDDSGTGTQSILNMLLSGYDSSKMNVIVCVGGSKSWSYDLSSNDNDGLSIYYLDPSKIKDTMWTEIKTAGAGNPKNYGTSESRDYVKYVYSYKDSDGNYLANKILNSCLVQLGNYGQVDMSDSSILSGFMNFSTNLFQAEHYGLILWDHGNGVAEGVCQSDEVTIGHKKIGGDMIEMSELEKALYDSDLIKSEKTLDFLGFDACLMGGTETALVLSNYYKYMLACEEIEMGDYGYNTLFKKLSALLEGYDTNDGAAKFALEALTDFTNTHTYKDEASLIQSAAVFDSKMVQENAASMLNDVSKSITELIGASENVDTVKKSAGTTESLNTSLYLKLRKAAVRCYNAGTSAASYAAARSDYVDILDYYTKLKEELEKSRIGVNGDILSDEENKYNQQLDAVIKEIDTALGKGFLDTAAITYKDKQILISGESYTSMNDAINAINEKDQRFMLTYNSLFYGASVFMPLTSNSGSSKTTIRNKPIAELYYKAYRNSEELGAYASFVKLMYDFENSKEELARIEALGAEIDYSKMVANVDSDTAGLVVSFVKDYQSGGYQPEHSSGDPMLDVVDTVNRISVFAAKKKTYTYYSQYDEGQYYKGADLQYHKIPEGQQENYADYPSENRYSPYETSPEVIVAEQQVKMQCISGANNAFIFTADQFTSLKGYTIQGFQMGSTYQDTATLSDLEQYTDNKKMAIEAAGVNTADENYSTNNYLTVQGAVITVTNGEVYQQQDNQIYHIFGCTGQDKNGNNLYSYFGTVHEYKNKSGKYLYENVCGNDTAVNKIAVSHLMVTTNTDSNGSETYSEVSYENVYGYQWLDYSVDDNNNSNPTLSDAKLDYDKEGAAATTVGNSTETVLGMIDKPADSNTQTNDQQQKEAAADVEKMTSESDETVKEGTAEGNTEEVDQETQQDEETALLNTDSSEESPTEETVDAQTDTAETFPAAENVVVPTEEMNVLPIE